MNRPHPNRLRSAPLGFTAIEMMVVIGIVVLLAGLLTAGMRAYLTSAQTESTRTVLETARSLFDEVNRDPVLRTRMNTTILPSLILNLDEGRRGIDDSGLRPAFAWTELRFAGQPELRYNAFAYVESPVFVDSERAENASLPDAHRYTAPAVILTHRVMASLAGRPSTRRFIESLPSERKLYILPAPWRDNDRNPLGMMTAQPSDNGDPGRIDPPMLLDAWGNPLIFVPDGIIGFRPSVGSTPAGSEANDNVGFIGRNWDNVRRGVSNPGDTTFLEGTIAYGVSGSTLSVYRAIRTHRKDDCALGDADFWQPISPIRSPDRRPFWISAGPDGNFATADDNLYSFDN
jgi:hypothetical protein